MSKFAKGEIAFAIHRFNGSQLECEIIAVPGHNIPGFVRDKYVIGVPENRSSPLPNHYHVAAEKYLKKKKPPEKASWEQVAEITKGWNPTKEKVHV